MQINRWLPVKSERETNNFWFDLKWFDLFIIYFVYTDVLMNALRMKR